MNLLKYLSMESSFQREGSACMKQLITAFKVACTGLVIDGQVFDKDKSWGGGGRLSTSD